MAAPGAAAGPVPAASPVRAAVRPGEAGGPVVRAPAPGAGVGVRGGAGATPVGCSPCWG